MFKDPLSTDTKIVCLHFLRKVIFLTDCLQDVDSGYLSKVNLDDSVSSLTDEVNFLKALYDTVHKHSILSNFSAVQLKTNKQENMETVLYSGLCLSTSVISINL